MNKTCISRPDHKVMFAIAAVLDDFLASLTLFFIYSNKSYHYLCEDASEKGKKRFRLEIGIFEFQGSILATYRSLPHIRHAQLQPILRLSVHLQPREWEQEGARIHVVFHQRLR